MFSKCPAGGVGKGRGGGGGGEVRGWVRCEDVGKRG